MWSVIRLGGCSGWSVSLLSAQTILLVLSWGSSNMTATLVAVEMNAQKTGSKIWQVVSYNSSLTFFSWIVTVKIKKIWTPEKIAVIILKFEPEHWSCIAHLSAEDMLKSAVTEEKKRSLKILNLSDLDQDQWMTLTFGTRKASCTHVVDCIYQLLYHSQQ